jgi:hypothetical protein
MTGKHLLVSALCFLMAGALIGVSHADRREGRVVSLSCLNNTSYANVNLNATQVRQYILNNATALTALIETLKNLSTPTLNLSAALIITYPNGTQTVDLSKLTGGCNRGKRDSSRHDARRRPREWPLRSQALEELGPFFAQYLPQLNPAPTDDCAEDVERVLGALIASNPTLYTALVAYIKQQLPTTWSQFITAGNRFRNSDAIENLAEEQPEILEQFILNNGLSAASLPTRKPVPFFPFFPFIWRN